MSSDNSIKFSDAEKLRKRLGKLPSKEERRLSNKELIFSMKTELIRLINTGYNYKDISVIIEQNCGLKISASTIKKYLLGYHQKSEVAQEIESSNNDGKSVKIDDTKSNKNTANITKSDSPHNTGQIVRDETPKEDSQKKRGHFLVKKDTEDL